MRLLRVRLLFVSALSISLALNGLIAANSSETLTTLAPPKASTSVLPPKMVNPPATKNPKSFAKSPSIPPTRLKTVSVAKVARDTKTVSQPTNIK
jgi:hypothetical protein